MIVQLKMQEEQFSVIHVAQISDWYLLKAFDFGISRGLEDFRCMSIDDDLKYLRSSLQLVSA